MCERVFVSVGVQAWVYTSVSVAVCVPMHMDVYVGGFVCVYMAVCLQMYA